MSDDERHDEGEETIGGTRITSTGREVFPEAGLSKGDVARHYARVGERMLEAASDRPLALLRCPDGISGECFYQKHWGHGFPDAVKTVPITEKDGDTEDYMYVSTPGGILGAVQMGTIEFHLWGARRDRLERPDRMVFNLDPDEGLEFGLVKEAAREVRARLSECGLESAAMVTGGKGIHVVVPLRRIAGWDVVKAFARDLAGTLAERAPERYTATMSKSERKGRIFIDWLRNERGATAIAPYALRARPGAPVAVPVEWDELDYLDRPNGFRTADMEARLARPCPMQRPKAHGISKGVRRALDDWAKG